MILFKNARIIDNNQLKKVDILTENSTITKIAAEITTKADVYDLNNLVVIGGAVDCHVHLRQPGFEYKEDISSATLAAAKGGITAVCAMPNLTPVPDSVDSFSYIADLIAKNANISVYQLCSITKGQKGGQLSDIDELSKYTLGFSDDGVGVDNLEILEMAMNKAKKYGLIIASHAESREAKDSVEAEIEAVRREIDLVRKTKCKYHFCHLSLRKSLELVENAQKEGLDITCEVTPHHLFLNENDVKDANFKMNPPLRSYDDMLATKEALLKGVATIIATDHAPHAKHEKLGYDMALNGIIGLETMLPLVYTNLIKKGNSSFNDMINWISINPARRFGIPFNEVKVGSKASFTAIDIDNWHSYSEKEILSKSKNSPFIGAKLYGFSKLTVNDGKIIYNNLGGKNYDETNTCS